MLFLCKTLRLLSSVQYQRVINCFLVQDLFGAHSTRNTDFWTIKISLHSTQPMDCIVFPWYCIYHLRWFAFSRKDVANQSVFGVYIYPTEPYKYRMMILFPCVSATWKARRFLRSQGAAFFCRLFFHLICSLLRYLSFGAEIFLSLLFCGIDVFRYRFPFVHSRSIFGLPCSWYRVVVVVRR